MLKTRSIQILKSLLPKIEIQPKDNQMIHSEWFLESLLNKCQGNVRKSTFKLKHLKTKISDIKKQMQQGKFKKSEDWNQRDL